MGLNDVHNTQMLHWLQSQTELITIPYYISKQHKAITANSNYQN